MGRSPEDLEKAFENIRDEFYPGSKKKIPQKKAPEKKAKEPEQRWDRNPKVYPLRGEPTEFFTIGALAEALGRKQVTIRMWEDNGIIPIAKYRTPNSQGSGGLAELKAGRRLYTRAQIEGVVKIAKEEGVLTGKVKDFSATNFTARVLALWEQT